MNITVYKVINEYDEEFVTCLDRKTADEWCELANNKGCQAFWWRGKEFRVKADTNTFKVPNKGNRAWSF
jgi:hypothetical protein